MVCHTSAEYGLYILENGGAEQDTEEWWNAITSTTKEIFTKTNIKPSEIAGLSFFTQMQGGYWLIRTETSCAVPILQTKQSMSVITIAATCEADMIDDIIVEIHNAGPELVTIHDRPEGSKLGKCNYIIEGEVPDGITEQQISSIFRNADVRFCGSFNAVSK